MRDADTPGSPPDSRRAAGECMVSIITPSLNRAPYLETCLESVRSQEYSNIEHIVIDGGSTDGTLDILRSWEESHNLRWISEPDQGMYHAINRGMGMARGDILAYVNTDDAYFPWSVRVAVDALSRGESVVFGDLLVVKEVRGKHLSYVQYYPAFDMGHYVWTQAIGQPTVFWRREAFERVGVFDTGYRLLADCHRWLTFARSGFVPKRLDEVMAIQVDHMDTLRESHAELLREEFDKLRASFADCAPKPASIRAQRLRLSVRWRAENWAMLAAYRSATPSRWPEFVGFLKTRGIRFYPSYAIAGLLPGPIRLGMGSTMLDGAAVVSAIAARQGGDSE